jgi:ABC-2 type transport system ATP-binding protein
MIEIKNLVKDFSGYKAVNIPSLEIPHGQCFGLAGNNGAGKTTLFRLIIDLIKATDGCVLINGIDVSKTEEWKSFTGSYLDEGFLIDFLTPDEYLAFVGKLNGISKDELELRIAAFDELFNGEIRGQKKYVRDLSKGNQKKLGVAAACISNPKLLVLDEPFANLDPSSQFRLKQLLKKLNENPDVTILISSHDLNHIAEVCDRIVIMEKGEIVKDLAANENTLGELEKHFAVE